jgi:hypothetical protein
MICRMANAVRRHCLKNTLNSIDSVYTAVSAVTGFRPYSSPTDIISGFPPEFSREKQLCRSEIGNDVKTCRHGFIEPPYIENPAPNYV